MSVIYSTVTSISPSEALSYGLLGVGVVAMSPALLPMAGFTASGVAAGSMAAAAQSAFYGPLTCGAFSVLQSAGMVATPFVGTAAASLSAGVVLQSERLQEALLDGAKATVPAAEAISDAAMAAGGRAKDVFWEAVEGGASAVGPAAEAASDAAVAASERLQEALSGALVGGAAAAVPMAEAFAGKLKAIAAGERVMDVFWGTSNTADLD